MRKLKSKFKKDLATTQRMKNESKHWEKGEFLGAYTFKDYQIFHSFVDGVNRELCEEFIESGYDMQVLEE